MAPVQNVVLLRSLVLIAVRWRGVSGGQIWGRKRGQIRGWRTRVCVRGLSQYLLSAEAGPWGKADGADVTHDPQPTGSCGGAAVGPVGLA